MNGEKRHKGLEITIYISLIIPAGIMAMYLLTFTPDDPVASLPFFVYSTLTFAVSLILSVIGLFKGSRLLRRHLLLWYGCLVTLILIIEVFVDEYFTDSAELANYILALGIVVLLALPVIWLRKASEGVSELIQ